MLVRLLALVAACSGENPARIAIEAQKAAEAAPAEGAWTCPMHPEVAEAGPGSCPKCGMPLVGAREMTCRR